MIQKVENQATPAAIALGMFDGMHIGHCALIARMVEIARKQGLRSVVYTFGNHPMGIYATAPKLLSTPEERAAAMGRLGVDRVEMALFDRELSNLSPEAFARMLAERYHARAVVAGFNYSFGKGGVGKEDDLKRLGGRFGFTVDVVPPVLYGGQPASSSRIRQALEQGRMEDAKAMLGYFYRLDGSVEGNRHIGRELGFPTANLTPPPDKLLPKTGVYATIADLGGARFPAVTNIGSNPTVQGNRTTIETHILAFSGDLYGKPLMVEFCSRLRDEHRFASKAELALQIGRDVDAAKGVFEKQERGA